MGKLQNFLLAGLTALLAVVGAELLLSWLLPFPDPYAGAKFGSSSSARSKESLARS